MRRAIEREAADEPFLARIDEALDNAGEAVPAARTIRERKQDLAVAIDSWKKLDRETAEARLFPLSQFMAEVFAAAMLSERAEWELREFGDDRKSLVAELYTQRYLAHPNAVRDIDAPVDPAIDRFGDLVAGAVVDVRAR